MPRTNNNAQGAEGGEEADRLTPLNPDQLDSQFRTPEMETTSQVVTKSFSPKWSGVSTVKIRLKISWSG